MQEGGKKARNESGRSGRGKARRKGVGGRVWPPTLRSALDPRVRRRRKVEVVPENEGNGDEGCEEADDEEIEDRVSRDDFPSLGALLEGVDRGPDLTVGGEPDWGATRKVRGLIRARVRRWSESDSQSMTE
jgi:hypothetical protein